MAITPAIRGQVKDARIEIIEDAPIRITRKEDFVQEISKLWSDAQRKFILIGRYLNQAKSALPHGDYEAMIERELPFGRAVVHQLRTVAEAIDAGELPLEKLPASYSIVYQITTLRSDEKEKAITENIIRPNVTRAELIAFKRSLRSFLVEDHTQLVREKYRLLAQQERITSRLEEIARTLGQTKLDKVE